VESKTENTPGDTPQRRGANSPVSSIFSEFQNPKLAMKANKKGPPRVNTSGTLWNFRILASYSRSTSNKPTAGQTTPAQPREWIGRQPSLYGNGNPRQCFSEGWQENCKVGVWSIFRTTGHESTEPASAENMDLTPSFWTLQFS